MENYDKIRVVGRGAYGVCWLCRRKEDPLAQKVIVKTIFIHGMSADEEKSIMGDFIAGEVKLLQKMHHPMIIGYYDYFVFENQLAIVMQYAEGGTMERLVQEQKGVNLPEATILIALNHIHSKSIVHRDLKTQNILLNRRVITRFDEKLASIDRE
ncbi:hypothetical protein Q1695_009672 [Nippostrongylus brasiliensis]|nr:hypothetical protein Q1695_009672 [Nippostrongylus brasiliensis]